MAVAGDLFVLGLIPSYVSIFLVEKHYIAFWTAFWNLYGVILTTVGLALDNYDPWWVWGIFVGAVILFGLAWLFFVSIDPSLESEVERAETWLVTRVGSSWAATSISWGLYFGFTAAWYWGLAALILHAIGVGFVLLIISES